MGAHIEWTAGILRLGKAFTKYGDPFEFACYMQRDGDTVQFKGATSECMASLISERKAVKEMLQAVGIKRVRWVRKINGTDKWFERDI